jgi:hypothetical protein
MGGACRVHTRKEICIQSFGRKTWGWDKLEDLGMDGRITLNMDLKEIRWKDWIHLLRIWTSGRILRTYVGYPESKFRWAIEKNKNLFPNHLYCPLMYIPYTTFWHSSHHCWGNCRSGAPAFVSLYRRMMPPVMQTTKFIRHNFVKKWPWNLWKTQGKWRNGESFVLLNLFFHCMHQILINHRRSAAPRIIMNIFTSFNKVSHPSPYHWITHGMFSICLTKLTIMSAGFTFLAFKKRITDGISHAVGFLIFLNIVNTQDDA